MPPEDFCNVLQRGVLSGENLSVGLFSPVHQEVTGQSCNICYRKVLPVCLPLFPPSFHTTVASIVETPMMYGVVLLVFIKTDFIVCVFSTLDQNYSGGFWYLNACSGFPWRIFLLHGLKAVFKRIFHSARIKSLEGQT